MHKYLSEYIALTRQKYFVITIYTYILMIVNTCEYFCAEPILSLPVGRTN